MIQLIRLIVKLVLMLSRANKKRASTGNQRKTDKLIAGINNGTVDLNTLKTEYVHRVGIETLPPDQLLAEDAVLEKAFLSIKNTAKYTLRQCKKITRGEYFFIVDSFIHDVTVTSIAGETKELVINQSYCFVFKKNSRTNSYEVYSDLYTTPQDKTIRTNYALLLFNQLKNNN